MTPLDIHRQAAAWSRRTVDPDAPGRMTNDTAIQSQATADDRSTQHAAIAAVALAGLSSAAAASNPDLVADVDPSAVLVKLVQRLTFGHTADELQLVNQRGFTGYLEYHLDHLAIDDSQFAQTLPFEVTLPLAPRYLVNNYGPDTLIPIITDAIIRRAVSSKRQLFERMVEFWGDHFNIYIRDDHQFVFKLINDRDVVRPNALGNFRTLLQAMAQSPAMLSFLDNDLNIAAHPNENYPRELLELHTMGIAGGYTEQDVREIARCLTGWSVVPWLNITDPNYGTFIFNAHHHDNGPKTVLGHHIPAGGGMQDGITVMNILADHPSTARHISTKIARWFLGDDAPRTIIDNATAAFTSSGGEIKAVIRAVVTPNALFNAGHKIKRPLHMIASALRALPFTIANVTTVRYWLESAGHMPFQWGPPDGYPDRFESWCRVMLPRWAAAGDIGNGTFTGLSLNTSAMFQGASTVGPATQRIDDVLFAGAMPVYDRERVANYLSAESPLTPVRLRSAVGMAVASPGFQLY